MKHLLTLKGVIIGVVVVTLLAGGVIFGSHVAFDVNVTGNVTLTVTGDPIQILSADGVTPINSGDALDFGTASVDFFGRGPVPVRGPFFVKNLSNGPVQVVVTGDLRDDIVPLFGPTIEELKPALGNAFTLAAPGLTGDTVRGFLGLRFLDPTAGSKQTTIIFRTTAITGDAGPTPIQPPSGMVAWWPGDGNASDIVGSNHGALNGATFAAGQVDQAFNVDGIDDFVEVPDSANLDITESIAVDAWINQRSRSPEVAPIVSKWNDLGFNNRSYHLVLQGSSLRWDVSRSGLFGPSQSATVFSSVGVPLNMWVHVAGTFDSATQVLRVYVNGVEAGSAVAPSSNIFSSNEPLLIGAGDIGGNVRDFFDGLIDEVEIFNRALTGDEIRAIFEAGSAGKRKPAGIAPPAGMVSWWPGDGNASDILDGNHGILTGDFSAGMVGQGFSLDGTGDFVLVADNPNLNITGDMTVDLWAKRTVFNRFVGMVVKGAAGSIGGIDVPSVINLEFSSSNRLEAFFERDNGSNVRLVGPIVTDINFHHYAYVRGGDHHKLFMDGDVVASGDFTGSPGDTSGLPLTIGALRHAPDPTGFVQYFGGVIDEVEVFNRALSDAEIRAIFEAGSAGKRKPASAPTHVVVPNAQTAAEGNQGNIFPFNIPGFNNTSAMRYQQVYASGDIGGAGIVDKIAFRPDFNSGVAFSANGVSVDIRLSHVPFSPDGLSATFSNNVGPDETVVLDTNSLSYSSDKANCGVAGPCDFDVIIDLNDVFTFNGTDNLLLDIRIRTADASTNAGFFEVGWKEWTPKSE